jgi:Tol biopolymer transport system component
VIAAADGSDPRQVTGPWALDPVWSPTGDRIAFISSDTNVYASNELHVFDVASGEVTPLVGMGEAVQIGGHQFVDGGSLPG